MNKALSINIRPIWQKTTNPGSENQVCNPVNAPAPGHETRWWRRSPADFTSLERAQSLASIYSISSGLLKWSP